MTIQFEKVNIEYLVAVIFLGLALLVGIVYGEKELAINIASGIIGYIGGRAVTAARTNNETRPQEPKNLPVEQLKERDINATSKH